MGKLFLHEVTSVELQARLEKGNARAILPIASTEMHGPHLPLGTDRYVAEGISIVLARREDAVILPTVSYTWSGFTAGWPGTMSLDADHVYRHLRRVCLASVQAGLRHILLVSSHGGNRWYVPQLARTFFEETGTPMVALDVFGRMAKETAQMFPAEEGFEASVLLASLEILGMGEKFPEASIVYDAPAPAAFPQSFREACRHGVVGSFSQAMEQHVRPTSKVSKAKGMEWLERLAEKSAGVFKSIEDWERDAAGLKNQGHLRQPNNVKRPAAE